MSDRHLDRIFKPRSVAVVGASNRAGSIGQIVLCNLIQGAFAGEIYAVNPKHEKIGSTDCFASIDALPMPVDLAVICTPACTVPDLIRQCGAEGILGVLIISAGFKESSKEGAALEREIAAIAKSFPGMRIVGPNCLGIISPHAGLNASFACDFPIRGNVALISQSGALCTALLDWALSEGIGFSQFVSIGNCLDVGIADLIDYFSTDQNTDAIILYLESVTDPRSFMSAARAFSRTKPIIAYKAGRFAESASAAASHTGALAGVDNVYDAALARAGIVRVFEVEDLFDCTEFLSRQQVPRGPRLAIVTNAGGPGVMATDELLQRGGKLAPLSPETIARLNKVLPSAWSGQNPVDILGDAPPQRFADALPIVLEDPNIDGLLVILSPQAMTDPLASAEALIQAARHSRKPIVASWMGGQRVRAGVEALNAANIPTYSTPEKAVRVFMHGVTYSRNQSLAYQSQRQHPVAFVSRRDERENRFRTITNHDRDLLTEYESKQILESFQIPVTDTRIALTVEDAVKAAQQIGFPVVLKVHSPNISHKTDVDGVKLNLSTAAELTTAFDQIYRNVSQIAPSIAWTGVTVQPMVTDPNGCELIVGVKRDAVFGPVILVGAGGVSAEVFHDTVIELPPLDEQLAIRMLESLKIWPILKGYRGRPAIALEQLVDVLLRLSRLVAERPEISELDMNPLWATPEKVLAMDARIVIDRTQRAKHLHDCSHLAIRPYPDEYIKTTSLTDGTSITLRPIKPEDEPLWQDLIKSCTAETIRSRFRYLFKASDHSIAAQFCFIDYDRDLAIVAEVTENGQNHLIGIAQLLSDSVHYEAEFAVIVADHWQRKGVGSMLADYCLGIGYRWGIRSVIAEVAPCNHRMLRMFENRGFELDHTQSNDVVIARQLRSANCP